MSMYIFLFSFLIESEANQGLNERKQNICQNLQNKGRDKEKARLELVRGNINELEQGKNPRGKEGCRVNAKNQKCCLYKKVPRNNITYIQQQKKISPLISTTFPPFQQLWSHVLILFTRNFLMEKIYTPVLNSC